METYKSLAEIMLPAGILLDFEITGLSKTHYSYTIILTEKNRSPKLPLEHRERKVTSKGFKDITINDFPLRGRKVILQIRRRVWKIEGIKKIFKNDLSLTQQGTKLEKEFAAFLKEVN